MQIAEYQYVAICQHINNHNNRINQKKDKKFLYIIKTYIPLQSQSTKIVVESVRSSRG